MYNQQYQQPQQPTADDQIKQLVTDMQRNLHNAYQVIEQSLANSQQIIQHLDSRQYHEGQQRQHIEMLEQQLAQQHAYLTQQHAHPGGAQPAPLPAAQVPPQPAQPMTAAGSTVSPMPPSGNLVGQVNQALARGSAPATADMQQLNQSAQAHFQQVDAAMQAQQQAMLQQQHAVEQQALRVQEQAEQHNHNRQTDLQQGQAGILQNPQAGHQHTQTQPGAVVTAEQEAQQLAQQATAQASSPANPQPGSGAVTNVPPSSPPPSSTTPPPPSPTRGSDPAT